MPISSPGEVRTMMQDRAISAWKGQGLTDNTMFMVDEVVTDGYTAQAPAQVDSNNPWAIVIMMQRSSRQTSIGRPGNRRFETTAQMIIRLSFPIDTGGMEKIDRISNALAASYLSPPFRNGIRGVSPSYTVTGKSEASINVEVKVPFTFDERK